MHIIADDANTIKERVNDVVLVDHRLCLRPGAASLHGSGTACRERNESGVMKGKVWEDVFSRNADLHGVIGGDKHDVWLLW